MSKQRKALIFRNVEDSPQPPESPRHSLQEAIEYVVTVKRAENLKERTVADYIVNMNYFTEWLGRDAGDVAAADITIDHLRKYVSWCANDKQYYEGHPYMSEFDRERKGLRPSSVNVRIRVLRLFFNCMYEEGLIPANPARRLSLMRQDIDTVQPLRDDELRRLLKAPDQRRYAQFRDYVIMSLILDTGIRINEICSLEISEVDLTARRINLPASKNKNRRSRVLPLSIEVVRLLGRYIKETVEFFPDVKNVFISAYGNPINGVAFSKALYDYARKAGIEARVTPHVLRHNFATMAALNGMDVFTLMKIMGHADISTTRKYVQISDADLASQHAEYSPLRRLVKRHPRSHN